MTTNDAMDVPAKRQMGQGALRVLLALALVGLGDSLTYGVAPELGLGLFLLAVVAAMVVLAVRPNVQRRLYVGAGLAVLGILPIFEAVTLWSVLAAMTGLAVFAVLLATELLEPTRLPAALLRFTALAPVRLVADIGVALSSNVLATLGQGLGRTLLVWVVPAGLALVFVLLFASANPLIDMVLHWLRPPSLSDWSWVEHIPFWGLLLFLLWPLLAPRLLPWSAPREPFGPYLPKTENALFGRAALFRALVLFNLIFAVQSLLDIAYLWGGVRLPDGMTYAEYAHRGAFPLIATALLAALFVLVAMRKDGPGEDDRVIRGLVYAWIGQNVLLVASSILRLDLYVGVYSLTGLRLVSGIWMALVGVGLVLILCRILWRRSNRWLVACNLLSLLVAVYGCAWMDLDLLIARFNVAHSAELGGEGQPLDVEYLACGTPTVIPALDDFIARVPQGVSKTQEVLAVRGALAAETLAPRDWRSWSWRDDRLARYLGVASSPASGNNSGCAEFWD